MKKACITGYGAIGPVHAQAVHQCKDAVLYAVCENNEQRAAKCAETYPVIVYPEFDKMLEDSEIDVVHICTPHYLHAEMTRKALAAGKEVVLEKPAALNRQELESLLEQNPQDRVCVMLQNRKNQSLELLHRILQKDKTIGEIQGISGFITWERTPEYYAQDDWRGKWATEGGGLMINQAVHTLDIMNWLGGGAESINASISTKLLGDCIEVEDTADALIWMKNGVRALFYGSNCYSTNAPVRLEVSCSKALFRYADSKLYKIVGRKVEVLADDITDCPGKDYWGSGHASVIQAFYSEPKKDFVTLEEAAGSMRLLYAFYESAKLGKTIKL